MTIKAYKWYGGKLRMAHTISLLMPEHTAYYEPFMGSGAVLLNHPRSSLEVLNDLDKDLACLMKTLADRQKGEILTERLGKLWYGREFFNEAAEHRKRHYRGLDDIEKSAMVFTLITQSFNGTRKDFSAKAYRDTNAYRADIKFHIPKVHERLKGVHVLNMDGIDLMAGIADNPNAFVFADPPYRKELRGAGSGKIYACELPHSQQVRMLKTIQRAKCKTMLCGYRAENGDDLYDAYLIPYGWKCYKLADVSKSCQASKEHRDIGHEYIWVNYQLPETAGFVISLKEYGAA